MRVGRWSVWMAATLVIAGCAAPQFDARDSLVLKERTGKFSVTSQAPNEAIQAVQGGFVWRRLVSGWQLDLNSPLGATLARLTVSPTGAVLERPDAPVQRAASGEDLLAGVLGASVPLDMLEDWVDGRVVDDSNVTNVMRDAQGRIVSFTQSGWQVEFDRYGASGAGRISAQGRQLGRSVTLKLVADEPT